MAMFDLTELVIELTNAGLLATLDNGKEPSLANLDDVGRIQVGYNSVESQDGLGDGISSDTMKKFEEDLSFIFYTQYTCKLENFPAFFDSVYAVVNNWTPGITNPDKDYTAVFLDKGGKKGVANGRIWWIDFWQVDFPRVESK